MIWCQNTCVNWCPLEGHPENCCHRSQILLEVPVSWLKPYVDCAFSVAAPALWNRLPADIRNVSPLENFKTPFQCRFLR